MEKMNIGIIGCGNISSIYLKNLKNLFKNTDVIACADLDIERAKAKAEEYGIEAMSPTELLKDPRIQLIVNLTIPAVHAEVALKALDAGKHVYSEKPFATTTEDGKKILEKAAAKGLRVGCAPDTFLGAGFQRTRRLLDEGGLGPCIAGTVFMLGHGPESWHPDPDFFYKTGGGPLFDMGPYYITALIHLLGPVKRLSGIAKASFAQRTITAEARKGQLIQVETPTHITASLEFSSGALITMIKSFDVWYHHLPRFQLFCQNGSIAPPDPNTFGAPVMVRRVGDEDWKEAPLVLPYSANSRGLGVADMVDSIQQNKVHRASGELSFHVLDVMETILKSSETGRCLELKSNCAKPEVLPANFLT